MYDFTKNEMEIIKDNLMSFIANFGKPRIERSDYGESFYVFTDDSDSWRQYCYNIDYLNGWLYGCVQTACGNLKRTVINVMYSHIQKTMNTRMQTELYMTQ